MPGLHTANMKPTPIGKANPFGFAPLSASNPSLLLEKLHARRSTPDSEALASSDDEAESQRQDNPQQTPVAAHKTVRRASWLNDTTSPLNQPRKGSFASSSMSPTTSHPSTPSAESGTWGPQGPPASATNGPVRGHPGSSASFPWGSGIWNAETRGKEPPSRLTEVLPSPASAIPGQTGNNIYGIDTNGPPHPLLRENTADGPIPFAIPLHPTPKTYRSQSYSVGQLDAESPAVNQTAPASQGFAGRGRGMHHSSLQHRPSRPSMLSEMSSDGTGLGKLKEVDDDNEDTTASPNRTNLQDTQAKALELLARENAMLRQQNYQTNLRLRPRSSTANAATNSYGSTNQYGPPEALPEVSEYAIDEQDEISELQDITHRGMLTRRMSEYSTGQMPRGTHMPPENRNLENVKKAYWQSSLGFGGVSDSPQSRRHSFADVPTRQGSVSSAGDPLTPRDLQGSDHLTPTDHTARFPEGPAFQVGDHVASYFGSMPPQSRNPDVYMTAAYPPSVYQSYGAMPPYSAPRPSSPHRGLYGVTQPRLNQLLYIVLFKCSRADVFYVQEGTGLSVKPGDLVIVEADRGTDLGTVAQENVDWAQAKELKDHYAEEHYKWLMMYSQGAVGSQDGTGAGLMAASNGLQGSAVGGMGPPSQHGMQDPNPGELKPKIIKRLAQNFEIQALRDKEGNEAKAKRVCMQKVKEHGLHMEILDAEFQMDWKKLTFYYFADAYINFNSLVTDLFKVYKTRIWMSAINPASFASPSLGLQAPSGVGPGAVGVPRAQQPDRRPRQQEPTSYNKAPQGGRAYQAPQATFPGPADRGITQVGYQPPFVYGYSAFAAPTRLGGSPGAFGPAILPQIGQLAGYGPSSDFSQMPARFPSPHAGNQSLDEGDFGRRENEHPAGNGAWVKSFQGLSLNTR